ncbi:cache domain-containing protein [Bradyrhizobium japonicum]|uniref:cache domain-containing protein n=1 Tax=Bradyrhizobium japonicum TaxID=375 RepID=UPI002714C34E|nr:cache domain-containing protein [Bradyrhizobium japonicum]WLB24455.1 cache domain-containing protein [Bradyrhizobium japonicum]
MDSIYAGFGNGAWLQVRRISDLTEEQRERLRAPANADIAISLIRPTAGGELCGEFFQDKQGNEIDEIDVWKYGYDARQRAWYWATVQADRPHVSEPYLSFSIGAPVITVSAPLRGKVRGVIAADLKLDSFSEFVQAQRPGEHGTVMIFDQAGSLIAHPEYSDLITSAMTQPARSSLPSIDELNTGTVGSVIRGSYNKGNYEGNIADGAGNGFLFRVTKFALGERYNGSILLLAAQDDFVQNVRRLQFNGLVLAILVGAGFIPLVWMFGSQMSRSIQRITAQARQLQTLAEPELVPVTSYIREIHQLGSTMNLAQRAIWSFAHFVPKEIVRGLIDNSISTELGGAKQDITLIFTDDHCGGRRSRRAYAADLAVLLSADGGLPCRGRHRRQVHRRRRNGVLECSESATRPRRARLPGGAGCQGCRTSHR